MLIIEHYNGEITEISIKHGWERNSWELIVNTDDNSSRTVFPIMGNVKSYTVVKRSRQAILDERIRDLAHDVRNRTCKHGSKLAACATCVLDDKDFRDYSQKCKHGSGTIPVRFDCIHGSPPCASCEDMPCTHGGHPATCVFCAESAANPTVRPPR